VQRNLRWVVPVAGLGALVALFLVLRPDGSPPPGQGGSSPSTSPGGERGADVEVRIDDGRVTAPDHVEVSQGSEVRIEVTADVEDEVHVHGYDIKREVAPGVPARITFAATIPGVFEVELEEAGLLLFRLEVTP
jgi:heme/copper-type cytochrome/quinol oxidase subunit 2